MGPKEAQENNNKFTKSRDLRTDLQNRVYHGGEGGQGGWTVRQWWKKGGTLVESVVLE